MMTTTYLPCLHLTKPFSPPTLPYLHHAPTTYIISATSSLPTPTYQPTHISFHPPPTSLSIYTHLYREPRRIVLPGLPRRLERAVRQPAQTLRGRGAGSDKGDVVAEGSHKGGRLVVVGVFKGDGVGDELWETRDR